MGSLMLLGAAAVLCGFWWSGRAQQRAQDQVQAKAKQATLPRVPGSAPGAQPLQIEIPLPSDRDMDRMMSFVERAWRRLIEMANRVQRDVNGGKI